MTVPSRLLLGAFVALSLISCKTISSKPVVLPDSPITYQTVSDMIDEETIEHSVKFRNIGNQIVSFDYTLADSPTVPHTDAEGPNSGLIENLYPGAEATVKNPLKSSRGLNVILGRITYGRRSTDQLAKQYRPSYVAASAAGNPALPSAILPPVETLPTP
jgi:hypothetical protein